MAWRRGGAFGIAMLCLLAGSGTGTAQAGPGEPDTGRPRAVIELFTSQGCSSCPPADALLGELAREPGLIALTLAIDYWDYLGWKDTLASTAYSERQRAYAEARRDRRIYTPQVVVNGVAHAVGHSREKIQKAVQMSAPGSHALIADVALSRRGGGVVIDIGADKPREAAEVWLFWVDPLVTVAIERGENAGHHMAYHNVVRRMRLVGHWGGTATSLDVADVVLGPGQKLAVLVQATREGRPGAILAATITDPGFASAIAGRWR